MTQRHRQEPGAPAHAVSSDAARTLRERLHLFHRITGDPARDLDAQLADALPLIAGAFGAANAIVSRIEGDTYTVLYVHTPNARLEPGETFPLGETYCSLTMAKGAVVAIDHMATSPYRRHPCYERFGLETYLGAPVFVEGRPYGTLNVSSPERRTRPFDDDDRAFMELLARWVGSALERRQAEAALRAREERYRSLFENALEGIFVSTPEGAVLEANPALARMLDYEDVDTLKAHLDTRTLYARPEDRDVILERLRTEGVLDGVESELRTHRGRRLIVKERSRGLFDEAGRLVAIEGRLTDITARKEAEERLRAQAAQYRELVDYTSAILWEGDARTFAFSFVSEEAEHLLGYPCARWIEEPSFWIDHIHPEDREWAPAYCARTTAEKRRHTFEYRMIAADGRVVWLRDVVNVLVEDGRPVKLVGVMIDITEEKEAELRLREAEAKFRALVEQSLTGIYIIQDGRFVYVNPVLADIFGYTQDEIVAGCTVADLVAEPDRALVQENLRRRLDAETNSIRYRFRGRRKDGAFIHVEVHGTRTHFEGRPAVIGTLIDVTEQIEAEARLRDAEAQFRGLVEQSLTGIYILTGDRLRYVNPQLCRMLGYTADELLDGMSIAPLILPEDLPMVRENLRKRYEGEEEAMRYTFRIRRKDGAVRHVEVHSRRTTFHGEVAVIGTLLDITDRVEAEAALRASEARLQAVVSALPDAIFRLDAEGTYLDYIAAEGFSPVVPPEVFLGHTLDEFLPTGVALKTRQAIRTALDTGTRQQIEYRLDEEGADQMYEARLVPEGGGTVLAFVHNITERKQAEMALKESQDRLRIALRAARGATFFCDLVHDVTRWDQASLTMFGIERDDGIVDYDTWIERVHPDDRERLAVEYAEALDSADEFDLEYRIIRPDGEGRTIRATGLITRDLEGRATHVYGLHFDVTERKAAEERLLQTLRLNQLLLETTLDGFLLADTEGHILDANPAYCRELGYTLEELRTMNVADLEARLSPEEIEERIAEMTAHGRARFQTRHRHKKGHALDFDASIVIVQPEDRPLVAAFMRNITEELRARREREELIAELEARNAELERFTYSVSHDLKSPLVTIQGFLGLLRRDLDAVNRESIEKDLHYISNAARTMQRLLDELLELSRIGRLINPSEQISLHDLAREAIDIVAGELAARDVSVSVDPALPRTFGDRTRLREVMQNLIANAVKFMGDQPAPHIEIGVERQGDEVRCFVRDNGIGIPAAYHEKVFGLFERLDNQTEGTGIGLALCKRIIELHGGRIWVESEGPGHGSTFYFTLPPPP